MGEGGRRGVGGSRREVALELNGDCVGVSSRPVNQGPPGILKGGEGLQQLREDGEVMVLVVIKRVCVRACWVERPQGSCSPHSPRPG